MAGFERDTFIAFVPEVVFDFVTDPSNARKVVDGVVSCEIVTDGPMGAGTRLRETREVHGKRATTELEVLEHQRPRRYVVVAEVSNIRMLFTYDFEPERDGTRVALTCRVSGRGVKRLMAPLVAAVLKREDGNHLERLREVMG